MFKPMERKKKLLLMEANLKRCDHTKNCMIRSLISWGARFFIPFFSRPFQYIRAFEVLFDNFVHSLIIDGRNFDYALWMNYLSNATVVL